MGLKDEQTRSEIAPLPEGSQFDWSDIWWIGDISYIFRVYFESFIATESDFAAKTVDAVSNVIMWVLEQRPAMAFIALDSGTSKRREIYPSYKSNRKSKTAEFWAAYDAMLRDLGYNFTNEGLNIVAAEGWEADDVMATLAKQAVASQKRCILMTQDKDLRQALVHGAVTTQRRTCDEMGRPVWGWMSCGGAEDNWGVDLKKFIDFQILIGDSTDGIPGCKGIGDVKARRLLDEYENIQGIATALDGGRIKGADAKNLREWFPLEPVTRQLVTLRTDVDLKNVIFDDGVIPKFLGNPVF